MRSLFAISGAILIFGVNCIQQYFSLDGEDWIVENFNRSVCATSTVPGNVYLDLQSNGIIADPLFRFNERDYKWIADEPEWIFRKSFRVTPRVFSNLNDVFLEFEGIDTVSTIYLNHRFVGHTDNMFRSWRFKLNDTILNYQEYNQLEVRIQSAVHYAQEAATRNRYSLPSSDWLQYSYPHRNMIRKSQSDFGWDWGPAFAGCGIYKSVRLIGGNEACISQCHVQQEFRTLGSVDLEITAILNDEIHCNGLIVEVSFDDMKASGLPDRIQNQGRQTISAKFNFTLSSPRRWWPHGYGDQHLYTLSCRVAGQNSSITKKIGIREIQLIREPIETDLGETFFFRVNGVDVFAKGANLVPLSSFPTTVKRYDLEVILRNAVQANMNMIRVWGGGLYQPDEFYDLADEFGILIWQELMFACATYPRDQNFLDNVALEVEEQLNRLKDHPSIALFGGNNENEAAMTWFEESRRNPALYFVDYAKLFIDVIRKKVLAVVPGAIFVVSSPSNGKISDDPFVLRWGDANSNLFGDIHFYDYQQDCSDPDIYPDARFISEFGFQSLPSISALSKVAQPEDLSWDSELMKFRQRHENGNDQLLEQIQRHFFVSNTTTFNSLIFLSQATQSICYRTAIEKWRRGRSKSRTMGVLYWQLNSVWPAPTWSSLEAGSQNWKMLHYHIKELFEPILMSFQKNTDAVDLFVITDLIPESQVTLVVRTYDSSGSILDEYFSKLLLKPQQNIYAFHLQTNEKPVVIAEAAIVRDGQVQYRNVGLFSKFKDLSLQDPGITIKHVSKIESRTVQIELRCTHLAAFVFLETPIEGKFSWNAPYFLFPNEDYTVNFTGEVAVDSESFTKTLKISSQFDTIPSSLRHLNSDAAIATQ